MKLKLILALLGTAGVLPAATETEKRLDKAATVFSEVMGIADRAIPQELLDRSHCVVIIPEMKKGAFIFGARYGRGFVSCRKKDGVGWTGPAGVRIEGGSFGLQVGGSETDVIMLVMNQRGVDRLMTSKFTLGGDAAVAAGPVGRAASAQTDALLTAEILTWSRSRGVFAGISLSGATLRQELSVNRELYGRTLENREIVLGNIPAPAKAEPLLALLNRYSSRK